MAVRKVGEGAARGIPSEFSAPIESSNGSVISDPPYLENVLDFLPPNGEINRY